MILLAHAVLSCVALAPAGDDSPTRLVLVPREAADGRTLARMGLDVTGPAPDGRGTQVLARDRDLAALADAGLDHLVLVDDLEAHYAARLAPLPAPVGTVGTGLTPPFGMGGMGGYHTFDEMVGILDQLIAAHPDKLTDKVSLATTAEGRDVWCVKLSDNPDVDEGEPELRFDAVHHAREPMSMESTLYFLSWVLENHGSDPLATYLVDERETWIIPCVNPDGYVYNEVQDPGGGGLWRKNRRDNGTGFFGVDLNRNYPFEWGHDDDGSSPNTWSSTYRGTAALSEPESTAIHGLMVARDFETVLSSHCHGGYWLTPWGYNVFIPLNYDEYLEVGGLACADSGYAVGPGWDLLNYPANGVTTDTDHGAHDSLAWTPEMGAGVGFWPPTSEIIPIAAENLLGFQVTALAAGPYARLLDVTLTDLGDGDGDLEPGETVGVVASVRNSGRRDSVVAVSLSTGAADLSVVDGAANLGTLASFTTADNGADPMLLAIDPGATPGAALTFEVTLDWEGPDEALEGVVDVGTPETGTWTDLGGGTSGVAGTPVLAGSGDLLSGTPFTVGVSQAPAGALCVVWLSFAPTPFPALGGTVHAAPFSQQLFRVADGAGQTSDGGLWPAGVPAATELTLQFIVEDPTVLPGLTLSNGLRATTP